MKGTHGSCMAHWHNIHRFFIEISLSAVSKYKVSIQHIVRLYRIEYLLSDDFNRIEHKRVDKSWTFGTFVYL